MPLSDFARDLEEAQKALAWQRKAQQFNAGRSVRVTRRQQFNPPAIETATTKPQDKDQAAIWPETVTFYADMGVHAARRYSFVGGGWRAYVLAKALDKTGLGMIPRDDLQAYALALGVHPRTFKRWMTQARNNDLIRDVQARGGEWMLLLPNPGAAAYGMGCKVGYRKLQIKPDLLIGKGWKAHAWAAVEAAGPDGRQLSREKLQKVYNVPVSTQRYRDAQAGVNRQRNYANLGIESTPNQVSMWKEFSSHKGVFLASNKKLYCRIPDTRSTDLALYVGKGRGRKANAKLSTLQNKNALLKKQQGLSQNFEISEYVRIFNLTPKQLKASKKKRGPNISELFLLYKMAKSGAGVWETVY